MIAFVLFADCDASAAARMAGYLDTGGSGIRVTAHRLLHDPAILAAIRETSLATTTADSPKLLRKLAQIAHNDQTSCDLPTGCPLGPDRAR